ncbi:MAG: hypothetical protein IPM97_12450 [Bdellovibrionaceae bacterium]|nr:hypothetical protein [Pseudobdellovibrionaceae bacterium]
MSKNFTSSVIFIFLALVATSCTKPPAMNGNTDSILPGPLKVSNNISQCPALSGTFTFEKDDGTTSEIEVNLDVQESTPVFTLNSSKFTVDGESHELDSMNEYQVGCSEGAIVVQYSMGHVALSKAEYRLENDSLVIIRKSLNDAVTIVGPEKSIGKLKVTRENNEN